MSREQLIEAVRLAAQPRVERVDEVPGLGTCFVRVMTPYDSDRARAALARHASKEDGCQMGRLLATVLCDAEGAALFDIDADADVYLLAHLRPEATRVIFAAHRKANGVAETQEGAEDLGNA